MEYQGWLMAKALVVNVAFDEFDVYIGRASPRHGLPASPFANPFRIGRDGTRAEVLLKYRQHLLRRPDLLARLPELRGKRLG